MPRLRAEQGPLTPAQASRYLARTLTFTLALSLSHHSAILLEVLGKSSDIGGGLSERRQLAIASTTKLMTARVALKLSLKPVCDLQPIAQPIARPSPLLA